MDEPSNIIPFPQEEKWFACDECGGVSFNILYPNLIVCEYCDVVMYNLICTQIGEDDTDEDPEE